MSERPIVLHDPTSELASAIRPRLAPPKSLEGKTIALLDLGKIRSDEFMDYVEPRLRARGLDVLRVAKPTNAKPAPTDVIHRIVTDADLVVEALAD
jgi:hypothetical protein